VSSVRIEQFAGQSLDGRGMMQMPELPSCAPAQTITSSGASAASAVLSANARCICVRTTGTPAVALRIGASTGGDPVAVASDPSVSDGERVWFGIPPSLIGRTDLKIAVIDSP
jgi:hypothetical protein